MSGVLKALCVVAAITVTPFTMAMDEGSLIKIGDNNVLSNGTFADVALPWFYGHSTLQYMESWVGKVKIAYRVFKPQGTSKGTIVLVNGRTEFMPKYAELVYDWMAPDQDGKDKGYTLVLFDHRGQGESQRLLGTDDLSNPDYFKGYVVSFQDYVSDLDQMITKVVPQVAGNKPVFILSHSTGGGVSFTYLEQKPDAVNGMVAVSPLIGDALPVPLQYRHEKKIFELEGSQDIALGIADGAVKLGLGKAFAPGKNANSWDEPWAGNVDNTSQNRYECGRQTTENNRSLIVAGPTNQWVQQTLKMGKFIRMNAENLAVPIQIFRAGNEQVVIPQFDDLIKSVTDQEHPGLVEIKEFPVSMHEILMETDPIRNLAKTSAMEFFDSHLPAN